MSETEASRSGVLLVGFGGPDSVESVRPFMCELMGREPSDEAVDEVRRRYLAIGGRSPLVEIAESMATALSESLESKLDSAIPVLVGMRYSEPSIRSAVTALAEAGVSRIVMCSLSPFESKVTHEAYREALAESLAEHPGLAVVEAAPIGALDAFAEIVAASAVSALGQLDPPTGALVVFTAHSLPLADLETDDPYVNGVRTVVEEACEYLGWNSGSDDQGEPLLPGVRTYGALDGEGQRWVLAYQSKGKRPGEWLGPALEDVIDAAHAAGLPSVVVVPAGFVTDHLETLYDLDIEAADRALRLGMEFVRGPVANEHEHLIAGLADAVGPLL